MKRRRSDDDKSTRSSPSASSSHGEGGMADTETDNPAAHSSEAGPSQDPPREATSRQQDAPPPPKKKRTRTLTTPHQSAVLHALLAQSRFPTTAMREEVGRSIGLSARKVQVWFQNQRQKARRPRPQTSALAVSRPLPYGAYPSAAPGAPSGGQPLQGPSHFSTLSFPQQSGPSQLSDTERGTLVGESSSRPGSSTFLSGPGVPGSSTQLGRPPAQPLPSPFYYSPVPHTPTEHGFMSSQWQTESWSPYETRGSSSRGRGQSLSPRAPRSGAAPPHTQERPIILPPLVFDESQRRPRLPSLTTHSPSSALPFSSFSMRGHSSHGPRTLPRLHIPPPLNIDTAPRWGSSPYSPIAAAPRDTFSTLPTPPGTVPARTQYRLPSPPGGWRAPSLSPSAGLASYAWPPSTSHITSPGPQLAPIRTTRFDPVRDAQQENETAGPSFGAAETKSRSQSPSVQDEDGDNDSHDREQSYAP